MLVLLITAAVAWFAGSAGSPICAERSPAQAHGLWHVLTAVLGVGVGEPGGVGGDARTASDGRVVAARRG